MDECVDAVAQPLSRAAERVGRSWSSPRNARRARRRLEKEIVREEREVVAFEEEEKGARREGF